MTSSQQKSLDPNPTWTRLDFELVAVLVFCGLLLRIIGLNEGMWIDEIGTLLDYVHVPVAEIASSYETRNNHIFYSILAHYSLAWFGESGWAFRLPAALLGVATIPAVYHLGRQLGSRSEALLAGALFVVSYHHVWFSQNARGYTGVLLGTLLLSIYVIRLIADDKSNHRTVLAYGSIAALTSWMHLTAALVVMSHGLIWLTLAVRRMVNGNSHFHWRVLIGVVVAGLFTMLLYTPVLSVLIGTYSLTKNLSLPTEISLPSIESLSDTFDIASDATAFDGSQMRWESAGWVLSEFWHGALQAVPGGWPVMLMGLVVMLVGLLSYIKQGRLAVAILAVPVLFTAVSVIIMPTVFFPRFLFGALGFFVLVAVRGGFVISHSILPMLSTRQVTAIGLILALVAATKVPPAWRAKQDFVGAKSLVESYQLAVDGVACGPHTYGALHRYLGMDCHSVLTVEELEQIEENHSRVWFLYTIPNRFKKHQRSLWEKVHDEYRFVVRMRGSVNGADIFIMLGSGDEPKGDDLEQ